MTRQAFWFSGETAGETGGSLAANFTGLDGLPALVGSLFVGGGHSSLLSASLSVVTPFANFNFVGLLIWGGVATLP